MTERKERPVLSGLLALVGVAAAVGLILGVGALAGARMLGFGGGSDTSGEPAKQSMYLPAPSPTDQSQSGGTSGGVAPTGPKKSRTAETGITLTAGQSAVSPMQQIDLSGNYPGGDGAILQVQRFQGGTWSDFPVTASVSGGSFATYIMTGQVGVNRLRVVDSDNGDRSNEVKVTVG